MNYLPIRNELLPFEVAVYHGVFRNGRVSLFLDPPSLNSERRVNDSADKRSRALGSQVTDIATRSHFAKGRVGYLPVECEMKSAH